MFLVRFLIDFIDGKETIRIDEQGGDPKSIDFCYRIGLDYVSCSPYRVPIARLSAAHATLKNK